MLAAATNAKTELTEVSSTFIIWLFHPFGKTLKYFACAAFKVSADFMQVRKNSIHVMQVQNTLIEISLEKISMPAPGFKSQDLQTQIFFQEHCLHELHQGPGLGIRTRDTFAF